MLKTALLAAARSPRARRLVEDAPLTSLLVDRYVAGVTLEDALRVARKLHSDGRYVTLDHLGEDTTDRAQATETMLAYQRLLASLNSAGLAPRAEVSVKLSAIGQLLPSDGKKVACENAHLICEAAARAGTTVTLDMEDHTTTDSTLEILGSLRADFPWVGAVLQAYLRRTEQDCRDLAGPGSRVRLCKGAYAEPTSVAFPHKSEVDLSYVRCLKILMSGSGYPMVASHDPVMVAIAADLAARAGRCPESYEFQMLYGVRDAEQHRLAAEGKTVRVYLPYGSEWFGYFVRRLAERPANIAFFLRSLAGA